MVVLGFAQDHEAQVTIFPISKIIGFESEKILADTPTKVLSFTQASVMCNASIVRSVPEIDYVKHEFYLGVKNTLNFYKFK